MSRCANEPTSQEPRATSQEPGARSQEPGARSQEPGARSQEPGAGYRVTEPEGVAMVAPALSRSLDVHKRPRTELGIGGRGSPGGRRSPGKCLADLPTNGWRLPIGGRRIPVNGQALRETGREISRATLRWSDAGPRYKKSYIYIICRTDRRLFSPFPNYFPLVAVKGGTTLRLARHSDAQRRPPQDDDAREKGWAG